MDSTTNPSDPKVKPKVRIFALLSSVPFLPESIALLIAKIDFFVFLEL